MYKEIQFETWPCVEATLRFLVLTDSRMLLHRTFQLMVKGNPMYRKEKDK